MPQTRSMKQLNITQEEKDAAWSLIKMNKDLQVLRNLKLDKGKKEDEFHKRKLLESYEKVLSDLTRTYYGVSEEIRKCTAEINKLKKELN